MASKRAKQIEDVGNNNGDDTDRISDLPEPLLHHILSFLPTKDVVQTCILAKQWKNFWRSITSLDFDDTLFSHSDPNFDNFVDSVLRFRDDLDIEKLRISCGNLDKNNPLSRINPFIISAMKRRLRVLDLKVSSKLFGLTRRVFTCTSLRVLKLSLNGFRLNFSTSIRLPMLKIMHLKQVKFHNLRMNEALFSRCPVLENLIIESCNFARVGSIKIYAHELRYLTVIGNLPFNTIFCTPNLVSFKFHYLQEEKVSLPSLLLYSSVCFVDNSSMVDADINLFVKSEAYGHGLREKRQILDHIKIPFCNLKLLKLETSFCDEHIVVINNFLKYSPNIETLVLENWEELFGRPTLRSKDFEEEELWFEYLLPHLKSVRIQNFEGSENEVKFVKFLLQHGPVLEKVVLVAPWFCGNLDIKEIGEMLLIHPSASQSVEILIK